jgi:plastocyanin
MGPFQWRTEAVKLVRTMQWRGILIVFAILLQSPGVSRAQATIEGEVELPKARSAPVANERYEIVSEAGILATDPPRAVVYLEGNFPKPAMLPTKEMGQKNLTFIPSLLPVEVGTKVEFPNYDDTYHNIFSYSPAKRFDLGRYPPNQKPTPFQIFDKVGLVTLRCDIHEHMRALILVLGTPYFTISDANGHYRLTNLPAGHFALKAWVSSKVTRERPVDLARNDVLHVDLP